MLKKAIPFFFILVLGFGGRLSAQSLKKIHLISSAPGQSNEASVIAQRLGFYRQEGFEVEIVVARSSTAIQAVLGGSAEYVNHSSVVPAILRGVPLRILLVDADKPPFYFVVAPKIATFKEVAGKTVAIDDFTGNAGMIARELLAKNGVAVDEVKFRVLGPPPFRLQALLGDAVDATLINFVMSGQARSQGYRVLAYSGDFVSTVQPALAATQTHLKNSPDEVYRLVKATLKGYLLMHQNPEEGLKFFAEVEGFSDISTARDAWAARLLRSS